MEISTKHAVGDYVAVKDYREEEVVGGRIQNITIRIDDKGVTISYLVGSNVNAEIEESQDL